MTLHFDPGTDTMAARSRLAGRRRVADALVQRSLAASPYAVNLNPHSPQRNEIGLALARIKSRPRTPVQLAFNEAPIGSGVTSRALDYGLGRGTVIPLHQPAGSLRSGMTERSGDVPTHRIFEDSLPMGQLFGTGEPHPNPVPLGGSVPIGKADATRNEGYIDPDTPHRDLERGFADPVRSRYHNLDEMTEMRNDDLLHGDHSGLLRDHQSTHFGPRNGQADESMGPLDLLGGLPMLFRNAGGSIGSYLLRHLGRELPLGTVRTKKPIWTPNPGKNLTTVQNAYKHWKDHGKQFPEFRNAKQYVEGATDFLNNPPAGTKVFRRANGDTLRYRSATNTFGVRNDKKVPRTMYKPRTGERYWRGQTKK